MSTSLSITSIIACGGSPSRITRPGVMAAIPLARPAARIKRGVRRFLRFRTHDVVVHAEPLLIAVLGIDDPQHHHTAIDLHRPAAGIVDGAVAFGAVVND